MHFVVKNEVRPFTSKISVILADLVEAATFTTTYLLLTSKWPCCFWLISNEDLSNMTLNNVDLRIPEKMKEAIDINRANELLIYMNFNFFWKFNLLENTCNRKLTLRQLRRWITDFVQSHDIQD
ncbi:hypothetical protein C1646_776768 [Rhizophagus diaphanus]|nr:hypothetical protein C1646_776768 [Rhizophagus diaphanus] [Rhizophagus sp. MUCL 43196]